MDKDNVRSHNKYPRNALGQRSASLPQNRFPAVPAAQLSLLDYLDQYLPDDESHFMMPDHDS